MDPTESSSKAVHPPSPVPSWTSVRTPLAGGGSRKKDWKQSDGRTPGTVGSLSWRACTVFHDRLRRGRENPSGRDKIVQFLD